MASQPIPYPRLAHRAVKCMTELSPGTPLFAQCTPPRPQPPSMPGQAQGLALCPLRFQPAHGPWPHRKSAHPQSPHSARKGKLQQPPKSLQVAEKRMSSKNKSSRNWQLVSALSRSVSSIVRTADGVRQEDMESQTQAWLPLQPWVCKRVEMWGERG
jgi:hypothetical protein